MTKFQSKHSVEYADSHSIEGTRSDPEGRDLGETMWVPSRVLVGGADEHVGCPLYPALDSDGGAGRAPSRDGLLDSLLRDPDMTVLDWSILSCVVLTTAHEDRGRDTCDEFPVSVDLKAVRRLGTILKRVSAGSRARRRITN
jgi:hypothetical protein